MREEYIRNTKEQKELATLRMLITKCPERSVSGEANNSLCRNLKT